MDLDEFNALYAQQINYGNVEQKPGEMSPRDRFYRIMNFKPADRMIDTEFGYWNDTLKRWQAEGLPSYVNTNEKADVYFGFDLWRKRVPVITGLHPEFEPEVIHDDGRKRVIFDHNRIKCQVFSDGKDTIPHYIEFPVKDRQSYTAFKERLIPGIEGRIGSGLEEAAGQIKTRNYILEVAGGSTAGIIRNWMGFENFCLAIYDQPQLIEEILNDLSAISAAIAGALTKHFSVDLVAWWEDIAFKNGPIVTPDFFNQVCGRSIKKVMDIYRGRGTPFAYVDCDGDFRRLIPGWIDNGVNIMFPLEVAAGIHPENLRREFPGIRMMGGFDKVVLLKEKSAIKKELLRLKALAAEGGFIPHVDHRVQADVPYKNYLDYLSLKREIFAIPNRVNG